MKLPQRYSDALVRVVGDITFNLVYAVWTCLANMTGYHVKTGKDFFSFYRRRKTVICQNPKFSAFVFLAVDAVGMKPILHNTTKLSFVFQWTCNSSTGKTRYSPETTSLI